jgi:hypothetical protein
MGLLTQPTAHAQPAHSRRYKRMKARYVSSLTGKYISRPGIHGRSFYR